MSIQGGKVANCAGRSLTTSYVPITLSSIVSKNFFFNVIRCCSTIVGLWRYIDPIDWTFAVALARPHCLYLANKNTYDECTGSWAGTFASANMLIVLLTPHLLYTYPHS